MIRPLCFLFAVLSFCHYLPAQSSQEEATTFSEADWNAIQQSTEAYAKAFNSRDAKALAELYGTTAEVVTSSGRSLQGRENIAAAYAEFFNANPDASLQIDVTSVKRVTPTIAIEEGRTETRLADEAPPIFSQYTAVHAEENGSWKLVSVRDTEVEPDDHGQNLEQLSWLIGRWIDEADDSVLEIDCYWHESGSYLIRDFKVRVEGLIASSGTERIGWDPLRGRVRSWLFDDDGGMLEADWIRSDDHWTVTAKGFRADGKPTTATYVVTRLKDDAYHMASFNRLAGDQTLDDLDMTIVRKPPVPSGDDADSDPTEAGNTPEANQ